MTVAIHALPRALERWLHDAAVTYFSAIVPNEPSPPPAEIADWFEDPNAYPLLVSNLHHRVGFALIERADNHHELSEFCILPDWRGAGLGTQAAALCFDRFPGPWTLGVASASPGTVRFWDRILTTLPGITGLARGPALTPYQCHSYTFAYKGAP